jgi:hypothetical protein
VSGEPASFAARFEQLPGFRTNRLFGPSVFQLERHDLDLVTLWRLVQEVPAIVVLAPVSVSLTAAGSSLVLSVLPASGGWTDERVDQALPTARRLSALLFPEGPPCPR